MYLLTMQILREKCQECFPSHAYAISTTFLSLFGESAFVIQLCLKLKHH